MYGELTFYGEVIEIYVHGTKLTSLDDIGCMIRLLIQIVTDFHT